MWIINPSGGVIKIDEKDIARNIIDWQKRLAVPQENYLLDDTILNNVVFLDEKNIDKENLKRNVLLLFPSLLLLEEGLDTVVGEKGSSLEDKFKE